jgi:2-keto-3-deoxy-L-fuconate dehydrogenase
MRLEGKVAVVTAAGQGIGKASVLAMAREGAEVWATDVKPDPLRAFDGIAISKLLSLMCLTGER